MKVAVLRSVRSGPVSSHAWFCLAGFPAGEAEKAKIYDGKIKEDGTMPGRFWKLLLSAHWLGELQAAPCFLTPRAAVFRKALAFRGFNRHHRHRMPYSHEFLPKANL